MLTVTRASVSLAFTVMESRGSSFDLACGGRGVWGNEPETNDTNILSGLLFLVTIVALSWVCNCPNFEFRSRIYVDFTGKLFVLAPNKDPCVPIRASCCFNSASGFVG